MDKFTSIGYLVWYNVTQDTVMDYEKFNELLWKTGAPVKPVKPPKAVNVFRRACESIDGTHDGWHYKMVDQGFNKLYVKRNLVRTKDLVTEVVSNAVMTKDDGAWHWVSWYDDCEYEQTVKTLISNFLQEHEKNIHSLPIRDSARRAIENNLRGVLVQRTGGVYFVAESEYSGLHNLATMMNSIDGVKVLMAPLVDTPEQRYMVKDALCDHVKVRLDDLSNQLDNKPDKLPAKKIKEWADEIESVSDRVKFYSNCIGSSIGIPEIEVIEKRIKDLWVT